ncbi:MAG: biosynthesis glycosyltransferase [Chloroflexi bacterium]|nr:biosynthesis glycosyltransferase [Chloroflexota bacterium]
MRPYRIAIVRALPGLGDLLCTVPAWRAIRAAHPNAHLTLVGLPTARQFVTRYHRYLDDFLEFPGFPGIPEQPLVVRRLPAFFALAQAQRFDLALQMHGSGENSNPFTVLLGAHYNAGFSVPGNYCPDPARFLPFLPAESEVRRYLRLLAHLGIPPQGEELEFPIRDEETRAFRRLVDTRDLQPGSYVCIHAGAKDEQRRWPPACFAAVADGLASAGLQVVLTGVAAEAGLVEAVATRMRAPAMNLSGRIPLGVLASLVQGAALVVCNDTGISHLAAALRVPSVVVFLASDPVRWAPLDRRRHKVVLGRLAASKIATPPSTHSRIPTVSVQTPAGAPAPENVLAEALALVRQCERRVQPLECQ